MQDSSVICAPPKHQKKIAPAAGRRERRAFNLFFRKDGGARQTLRFFHRHNKWTWSFPPRRLGIRHSTSRLHGTRPTADSKSPTPKWTCAQSTPAPGGRRYMSSGSPTANNSTCMRTSRTLVHAPPPHQWFPLTADPPRPICARTVMRAIFFDGGGSEAAPKSRKILPSSLSRSSAGGV